MAANILFTSEMPIAHMTSEDIRILETALFETLDSAPDGDTRHWENPKTQAHGDLTPRSTFTDAGLRCRMVQIENSAGGRNNRSMFTLCKGAEGWKVRSY
jgi:surface antigen